MQTLHTSRYTLSIMKKETKQQHQTLLYYMYTNIIDPETLKKWQLELCKNLNLTGRIIVAHEGINGTLEGTVENTKRYMREMRQDSRFKNIHWKRSVSDGNNFPRLSVKVKPEIVNLGLGEDDVDPNQITGNRLKPDELHEWYQKGEDFVMIDMRNDYEHMVGRFKNSIEPDTRYFRDLKGQMNKLEQFKDKKVITVCTGGVRCEKASGYLKSQGFDEVYQLDGGIVSYMEKYPGENFEGSLYVFDNRQTMHFNDPENHTPITKCEHCHKPSDYMCNCANTDCNKKYVGCPDCVPTNRHRECTTCATVATS